MENLEFAEFSILHIVAVICITCEYYAQTVSIHVVSAPVRNVSANKTNQ